MPMGGDDQSCVKVACYNQNSGFLIFTLQQKCLLLQPFLLAEMIPRACEHAVCLVV